MTEHKKRAFTLIESLICITVISLSVITATKMVSVYQKTVHERDVKMQAMAENISILEDIKLNVKNLTDLYFYAQDKKIKVYAIGFGEIELSEDGSFTVINSEEDIFSDIIKPKSPALFRLETGDIQKISAVIRL